MMEINYYCFEELKNSIEKLKTKKDQEREKIQFLKE